MTATEEQVTRAICQALGYDPDTHDLDNVGGRWPGVRVRKGRRAVVFIRQPDFEALMKDPERVIAFKVFLERQLRGT